MTGPQCTDHGVTDLFRYTVEPIFPGGAGFRIDPQGDWVRFEDVAPELARLRAREKLLLDAHTGCGCEPTCAVCREKGFT
jgi:hypothetical protein